MGHLRGNGFRVQKKDVFGKQLTDVKTKHGVPSRLHSCHTAAIDGYIIEGHVPADLIKRLLKERPPIVGLAVPGMPVGSPGMEGPNPEPGKPSARALHLPDEPYRYADPELPAHFRTAAARRFDNTPRDNRVTDSGATLGRVLFYDTRLSANNTSIVFHFRACRFNRVG